ncbi:hypothetical protein BCV69DRAFT_280058 [Microstroma glucosiphilum]|uniref:Uncharacterized protein n=1 Tax=Pseudomicrostroma glucosiphilum TaxID=1684307 RepID=A0A316UIK4_9BASI|nr:hypothetical protein BCV69DRAFT_280058 [Pseudomicrostroma glucosiphilum]PWN24161.1 hypothetical protein BCV69DRAFT_280058 [Pseudomicrostroma glucosiphilum]
MLQDSSLFPFLPVFLLSLFAPPLLSPLFTLVHSLRTRPRTHIFPPRRFFILDPTYHLPARSARL